MFSSKDLKVKLVYMSFGGMIAIFGMLFGIGLLSCAARPSITADAQHKSQAPSNESNKDRFGDIECTSLTVVDANGNPVVVLKASQFGGGFVAAYSNDGNQAASLSANLPVGMYYGGGSVSVSGTNGKVLLSINEDGGLVTSFGKGGNPQVALVADERGGRISVHDNNGRSKASLSVGKHGGYVNVSSNDDLLDDLLLGGASIGVGEHGGYVSTSGNTTFGKTGLPLASARLSVDKFGGRLDLKSKDAKSSVEIGIAQHGGAVTASGNNGERVALLGVDKHGGGTVAVYDNDGKPVGALGNGEDGGLVKVFNNDMNTVAAVASYDSGGVISVFGAEGKSGTVLGINEYGGFVTTYDKDGKTRGGIGIDEYGNGQIFTWDKNGHRQ